MKALKTRRFTLVTAVLAVLLAVTFLVSFALGRYPIPPLEAAAILWDAVLETIAFAKEIGATVLIIL